MGNSDDSNDLKYVKFESPCPVCLNNKNIYWVHTNDNCHEQINVRGEIKCDDVNCKYHSSPLFIMNWAFNCGEHYKQYGRDYINPSKTRALDAIHMLANNADLNFSREDENYIIERILKWNN